MQERSHVVVWIDHLQARIFHVGLTGTDQVVLKSHLPTQHIHHKANTIGSGHVAEDQDFLKHIAEAVQGAEQILILGPSSEKTVLHTYLREHAPASSDRVIAVEPADHPTDGEIVAYAKRHFRFGEAPRATSP
jgi:stalled ribosome rescue protein Dom34